MSINRRDVLKMAAVLGGFSLTPGFLWAQSLDLEKKM